MRAEAGSHSKRPSAAACPPKSRRHRRSCRDFGRLRSSRIVRAAGLAASCQAKSDLWAGQERQRGLVLVAQAVLALDDSAR